MTVSLNMSSVKSMKTTVDFAESFRLLFPRRSVDDYVIFRNVITRPLTAVTVCFWVKTSDKENVGRIFHYSAVAAGGGDDEFEIFDYKHLSVSINGYDSFCITIQ